MSEDSEESTKFIRQRRDLFVISGILLIVHFASITLNKEWQFGGISINVGKPEIIFYCLWALWAYWYLRYFQAYKQLGGGFLDAKFKSEIGQRLFRTFRDLSESYKKELIQDGVLNETSNSTNIKTEDYLLLHAKCTFEFSSYSPEDGNVARATKVISYGGFRYYFLQVRVLMKCCVNNIDFTEYYFPFLFGLSPLLIHFW